MNFSPCFRQVGGWLVVAILTGFAPPGAGGETPWQVGVARRDITPAPPIWLAGYAARKRAADQVDQPLLVQAITLRAGTGEPFVFVALDNCEVSRSFMDPVWKELQAKHRLRKGQVMIISSHTHSAPVLDQTLSGMFELAAPDQARVQEYSQTVRSKIVEVIGAALEQTLPGTLEYGVGRARFAINRRVYQNDKINFGDNPDGPVDWDVPVLKVKGTNDAVRAVIFGYACHGTSISGADFYTVSGDYMAYARQHLEGHYPQSTALYFTGMGADSNPSPRGSILDAKRHGLELAGAVVSVLDRPMRRLSAELTFAFREVELPLLAGPTREKLEADQQSTDLHVRARAKTWLEQLQTGSGLPRSVPLPMAAVRVGRELTMLAMGGEVVVDYSLKFKRLFAGDHPWTIGYAYEIPAYIPSIRILKEGGYEADSSLIYYGIYGPFATTVEDLIVNAMTELVQEVRRGH